MVSYFAQTGFEMRFYLFVGVLGRFSRRRVDDLSAQHCRKRNSVDDEFAHHLFHAVFLRKIEHFSVMRLILREIGSVCHGETRLGKFFIIRVQFRVGQRFDIKTRFEGIVYAHIARHADKGFELKFFLRLSRIII